MSKAKPTLYASAPSKAGIMECIGRFYCGTPMELLDSGRLRHLSDGRMVEGTHVTRKAGRWRLESLESAP